MAFDINENSAYEFNKVPEDFPRSMHIGSVGGAQPKFLAALYQGKFYEHGTTPPEVYERWVVCVDLAEQLSEKALKSKAGKRAHMSEAEILQQYFDRLLATKWTSDAEAHWIIRKVASTLDWKFPF